MDRDTLFIRDLSVNCVIGIYPEERLREQPVTLDLCAAVALSQAGRHGDLGASCDYDRLSEEIAALLRFRRYLLLESAAEELAALCLGLHPNLTKVELTLAKPHALRGRAGSAGVVVRRTRQDFPRRREDTSFGWVDILLETKNAGLYLLHIAPGREIVPHYHVKMRELEWLVEGELWRDHAEMQAWQPTQWPARQIHTYRNQSSRVATLFCCDTPPFERSDEIEVGSERDLQVRAQGLLLP